MAINISLDLLAVLTSVLFVYVINRIRKRNLPPLPPGPKGYPLIGNLLDIPSEYQWVKFHEWCKDYGSDIIHINILGQDVIVLDSKEAATDLMEKRSSIYSDRPIFTMIVELMGFEYHFGFMRFGDKWRSQRRMTDEVFHPKGAKTLRPHSLKSAREVLRRFLERPKDVNGHIHHMAGSSIMSMVYGLEVKSDNDPHLKAAEDAVRLLVQEVEPGDSIIDLLPMLKYIPEWMPGGKFHAKARRGRSIASKTLELPYRAAKAHLDKGGNYMSSFMSHVYSRFGDKTLSAQEEWVIKGAAASIYTSGSDTTASTIICGILALLDHPDILKRAQAEIDSVVPFGDLPTYDDEDKLPFITALSMEVIRWKELVPLGFPHRLMEDDIYKGYRLPKGSVVMANIWAMLHDENVYPEPFSFKPDRFLKDGYINKEVRDPAHAAFGFGRRICPGRFVAFPAVWITLASLIAAFDIKKSVDENGKVIEVSHCLEGYGGPLRSPKPFECSIKPRSPKHEQAIRADLANGD